MTDLQKHGQKLLAEALKQLWEAMLELTQPTSPQTPLPRPPAKPIKITHKVVFEVLLDREGSSTVYFFADGYCVGRLTACNGTSHAVDSSRLAGDMMPYLSHPRSLAHCLRQLRWLAAWMRKRAEGRRRAAEEILRQQRKWVEMLESEVALQELAK